MRQEKSEDSPAALDHTPNGLTLEEVREAARPDVLQLTNGQQVEGYVASEDAEQYEVYVPVRKGAFLRTIIRKARVESVAYAAEAARAAMRQKWEWWRTATPDYAKWSGYTSTYLSDWHGLQGWRVQGKFFTLETDFAEDAALQFAQTLDTVYPEYCRVWQLRPRTPKFIRARVFREARDYVRVLRREGVEPERAHNTAGMFLWRHRLVFVRDAPARRPGKRIHGLHTASWGTLLHECHHAFVYREIRNNGRRPPFPIWVEEGLAEYFEHSDLVDGKMHTGAIDSKTVTRLQASLANGKFIPLGQLLRITDYESVDNAVAYPEYWALVHYLEREGLVRGTGGWSQFAGQHDRDSLRTFQQVIGKPLAQFAAEWRAYIQGLAPS